LTFRRRIDNILNTVNDSSYRYGLAWARAKSPSLGRSFMFATALIIGFVFTFAAGTALAESRESDIDDDPIAVDPEDYWRSGPYLHAGFVQAWGHFDDPVTPRGLGMNVALGGRFTRYIAAELDYEGVYSWSIKGVDTSTYAVMANVKGYLPLGGIGPIKSIQPFAIGGVGFLLEQKGKTFVSRVGYRLGGGADFFLSESLYLSLAYRYTGNFDTFGYSNILYGIGYKFD
jgi:opacity protein-like surface antigen